MRTFVTSTFEKCIKDLTEAERANVIEIIKKAGEQFGFPHAHGGLSIRPFGAEYECRDALDKRLIFKKVPPDELWFVFYGDHDQVRTRAKNAKKKKKH